MPELNDHSAWVLVEIKILSYPIRVGYANCFFTFIYHVHGHGPGGLFLLNLGLSPINGSMRKTRRRTVAEKPHPLGSNQPAARRGKNMVVASYAA